MKAITDLSGKAFGNVDATRDVAGVVSYLEAASMHFRELKRHSYRLLAVKPGNAVLDVGCGIGDDIRELAPILGRQGRIVGIDSSKTMIAEARRRSIAMRPRPEFRFAQADRIRCRSDTFDACRADRVFQHLAHPRDALMEMVRVTKPGGTVQAIDRDWGLIAIDAENQAVTRTILNRIREGIRNGWIGRHLPALFHDCGIQRIQIKAVPIVMRDFRVADTLLDLTIVAGHAAAEGILTKKEVTTWLHDLDVRDKAGVFFATLVMFIVTGKKSVRS